MEAGHEQLHPFPAVLEVCDIDVWARISQYLSSTWSRPLCMVRALEVFGDFIHAFMELTLSDSMWSTFPPWIGTIVWCQREHTWWLISPGWDPHVSRTLCPSVVYGTCICCMPNLDLDIRRTQIIFTFGSYGTVPIESQPRSQDACSTMSQLCWNVPSIMVSSDLFCFPDTLCIDYFFFLPQEWFFFFLTSPFLTWHQALPGIRLCFSSHRETFLSCSLAPSPLSPKPSVAT